MLNRNTRYSEWLLPYLEGGLDEARRAQLEARLAVDPALADEARRLAQTLGGLRGAASRAPRPENASVPADLWPHLRARLVLDPAPRPRARAWWLAGVGAPAVAALIVAAFWLPGWHSLPQPTLAPKPTLAPRPTSAPRPATTPKAVIPSTAVPVTPKPAPPPHPAISPARSVKPAPVADVGTAKPGAAVLNAAPPASPFDLPAPPAAVTPAPASRVRRAAVAPPAPMTVPTAPTAKAVAPQAPAAVTPSAPKPALPPPSAPLTATAGAAGLAGGAAPKETRNSADDAVSQRAKTQPDAAPPGAPPSAPQMFAPAAPGGLDSWQAALAAAVRPPHWGGDEGDAQANQALMAARESGQLDDLRARLEARRTQSPHDPVTGRMLAAVYDFGFSPESALRERRRVSGLEGADGEDWYALAQAEERAGNRAAARAAYQRALESAVPPSPFHAAIARGKV